MKGGHSMANYLFNLEADNNGYHEVHKDTCTHLPNIFNRQNLGNFTSCNQAIQHARINYSNYKFDGCYYCCNECHNL